MRFKDITTGNILETNNAFVIEQYKKTPEKYEEIKPKTTPKKVDKE